MSQSPDRSRALTLAAAGERVAMRPASAAVAVAIVAINALLSPGASAIG